MILHRAPCGHFAIDDEDGAPFLRICRCRVTKEAAPVRASAPGHATCPDCQRSRGSGPVHAPRLVGSEIRDCAGRFVRRAGPA